MPDFSFQVVADATKADKEIDSVVDKLGKIPVAAKRAGEATTNAMLDAMAATKRHNEMIEREHRLLEQIHGPAKRYADDLQAMDSLLHRNAVSAAEYAAQVTRLNHQIDGRPKVAATSAGLVGGTPKDQLAEISAFSKQAADSAKLLTQRVHEVGKNLSFGLAAQGLGALKQELDGTGAAALGAAANGAAMGATFGGPWGAAIGGAIGLAKGLVTGLLDDEKAAEAARKKTEELGKAYWESVRAAQAKQDVTASLAPVLLDLAGAEKEAAEAAAEHNRVFTESSEAFRHAADKARAYQDQLVDINAKLREQLGLQGQLAGGGFHGVLADTQSDDAAAAIRASRGLRDAELEKYAATKSYGDALRDLQGAENHHNDRLRDLEGILGDINVSESVRAKAFAEYDKLVKGTTASLREQAKAELDLVGMIRFRLAAEAASQEARDKRFFAAALDSGVDEQNSHDRENLGNAIALENSKSKVGASPKDWEATRDNLRVVRQIIAETQADLDKMNTDKARQEFHDLGTSLRPVGDALTNMFLQWDFSAQTLESTLKDVAIQLLKVAAIRALGGAGATGGAGVLVGLLGGGANGFDYTANGNAMQLPGFATGVDAMIGGRPGLDQNLIAFWGSQGESFHVRTQQQRIEAQRGQAEGAAPGGGDVQVINQYQDEPRALRESMNTREGARVIYNQMRRLKR